MEQIRKYYLELIGALVGALSGFLYWKFVGCLSGTCAIQSNPWISTVYGMVMGVLLAGLLKDLVEKIRAKRKV